MTRDLQDTEPAPEGLTWTSMLLTPGTAYECESERHEDQGIPAHFVEWLWIPDQKTIWRHWNACIGCNQAMKDSYAADDADAR